MRRSLRIIMAFFAVWLALFPPTIEGSTGGEFKATRRHMVFGSDSSTAVALHPDPPPASSIVSVKRSRVVKIDSLLSDRRRVAMGDTLALSLFADRQHEALVDRVVEDVNGVVTVRGRVTGSEWGFALFSTSEGRTLGVVEIPETGERYEVRFDAASGLHHLLEVDEIAPFECGVDDLPGAPETDDARSRSGHDPFEPVIVDVMVVYTPAAREYANAHMGGIHNVIAQAMAQGQLTLDNSATYLAINLIYSAETDYVDSGDMSLDIGRLRLNGDGHMDEVHQWRDAVGADLVVLLTTSNNFGGMANLPTNPDGDSTSAFSIVDVAYANSFVLIHELGHNLGCHHHKDQNFSPGPGIFSYSAGWRWIGNNGQRYCSVMTYPDGSFYEDGRTHARVLQFSSPSILHQGVPAGHGAHGDNARTIREFKHATAAYKTLINDAFEEAAWCFGDCNSVAQNNLQAGKEPGEPDHAGNSGGASLWWQWTAPSNGSVVFGTEGSTFNTLLGVYIGESLDQLILVASNDDAEEGVDYSRVAFDVEKGTTYRIAVDGFNAQRGAVRLEWCLTRSGSVVGWGSNSFGQNTVPRPNEDFMAIATVSNHSLGLRLDGSIVGWGSNTSGQIIIPEPNKDFVAIATGLGYGLGLKSDGSIVGWGSNTHGQIEVPEPNEDFVAIAAGFSHSMGLKSDGTIVGWGNNSSNQLTIPPPNEGFVAIAAGASHSLGLKSDGSVLGWGHNDAGQATAPLPNEDFVSIAAGYFYSLGLKSDGSIVGWGRNERGQSTPPSPNENFVAISAGYRHSLGLKHDGSIVAWGDNGSQQTVVPLPNEGFADIAAGWSNSLARRSMGFGGIEVEILPEEARHPGAQWRRVGTVEWRDSGDAEPGVPAGNHLIEFKEIDGWSKPDLQIVTVVMGETAAVEGTYTPLVLGYDINGDGIINVADVTALANLIAGGTPSVEAGDLNGDGVVNMADVHALSEVIVD